MRNFFASLGFCKSRGEIEEAVKYQNEMSALESELKRIRQEMILVREGRRSECLTRNESVQITIDVIKNNGL